MSTHIPESKFSSSRFQNLSRHRLTLTGTELVMNTHDLILPIDPGELSGHVLCAVGACIVHNDDFPAQRATRSSALGDQARQDDERTSLQRCGREAR